MNDRKPKRSRAFPPPVKAARAITRALDGLSPEDRLEAVLLAFPESDPSTVHARQRMAMEAALSVLQNLSYPGDTPQRILKKGLHPPGGLSS